MGLPVIDNFPEKLRLRDTELYDDQGGLGQRIFTTAGAGYVKQEYVRADLYDNSQAQLDAVKWQPIETAPKQGAILLWVPENKCTYCAIWSKNGCGYTGWVIFGGEWREHLQRATHWMPLPQALEQE